MNIQDLIGHSAKGNKSTPADDRKLLSKDVFSAKKNFAVKVLEASEKNLGFSSSHRESDMEDSDSSSDNNDFEFEEVQDEITITPNNQAKMPTMLFIKPKSPHSENDSTVVNERKVYKQSLFQTKVVKVIDAKPQLIQKKEEAVEQEQIHTITFPQKQAKSVGSFGK